MRLSQAADQGELLKAALQASADEIVVFGADTLRILRANRAAAKNPQRPLKALRLLTPLEWVSAHHVHAFTISLATLRGAKKKRRVTFATWCRREDGSTYPVEAKLIRSVSHGSPVFIWSACGVSEREAREQAWAIRWRTCPPSSAAFPNVQHPGMTGIIASGGSSACRTSFPSATDRRSPLTSRPGMQFSNTHGNPAMRV